MVDRKGIIKLTQKLIQIDSQNPGSNEERIARFVQGYLADMGIRAKIYEFLPKRANVVAVLPGRKDSTSLLLIPHLDTVPAGKGWKVNPFSGLVRQGRLYGLGATDCKGNLACALEALKQLRENRIKLDYRLVFAATANEEAGSEFGLIPLLDKGILDVQAALVLDADDFDIIVAQKGLLHLKVKIKGKRAHGAYPWRGKNAIDIAVLVLHEIKEFPFKYVPHKLLRPPTVNIGTIRGGDKVNIVADWCEFELDFRFLPGMSVDEILRKLKGIILKYTRNFEIEIEGVQKDYQISPRHPLVASLYQAMHTCRITPHLKGSEGATSITFFQDKNIAAVATGFGSGGCAHSIDEYVKVDNLYRGVEVLVEFLKNYNCKR